MTPARRIDLHGSIESHDTSGHRAVFDFHGDRITVELNSVRAALAAREVALSAIRSMGGSAAGHSKSWSVIAEKARDFQLHVCIRGCRIAVAGVGVQPNWLGTRLAGFPVNVTVFGLLKALLRLS